MTNERKKLGRGLDFLLSRNDPRKADSLVYLPVDKLYRNPGQPRTNFDEQSLRELRDSISENGLLQPLVVRPSAEGYEVIAGERRLRACKMLAMQTVPCVIREAAPGKALELALVENLQREDLNAMDRARAYDKLVKKFNMPQAEVAQRIGKSRAAVTNTLRLLQLPRKIQNALAEGRITEGHARAILALEDEDARIKMLERILKENLSVREVEGAGNGAGGGRAVFKYERKPKPSYIVALEERLQKVLGTKVSIKHARSGKGSIIIRYYSNDELTGLAEKIEELVEHG